MLSVSRLRLITFDVTGTILKFKKSPGKIYKEVGVMHGVTCDSEILNNNFKNHWRRMNKEHPNYGKDTGLGWEKWWKSIVISTFKDSKANASDDKIDNIANHLIKLFQTSDCWEQAYGVLGLLSYLRNQNVRLGIISNSDPRLYQILINTKLRHYFNFVLISYEFGKSKPHRQIFDEAIRKAELEDLKGNECLHIGNMANLDYWAARNSGWNGILIHDDNNEELKDIDPKHLYKNLYSLHKDLLSNRTITLNEQQAKPIM